MKKYLLSLDPLLIDFTYTSILSPEFAEALLAIVWSRPVSWNREKYPSLAFFLINNDKLLAALMTHDSLAVIDKYLALDWSEVQIIADTPVGGLVAGLIFSEPGKKLLNAILQERTRVDLCFEKLLSLDWMMLMPVEENEITTFGYYIIYQETKGGLLISGLLKHEKFVERLVLKIAPFLGNLVGSEHGRKLFQKMLGVRGLIGQIVRIFLELDWMEMMQQGPLKVVIILGWVLRLPEEHKPMFDYLFADETLRRQFFAKFMALDWTRLIGRDGEQSRAIWETLVVGQGCIDILERLLADEEYGDAARQKLLSVNWAKDGVLSEAFILSAHGSWLLTQFNARRRSYGEQFIRIILALDWDKHESFGESLISSNHGMEFLGHMLQVAVRKDNDLMMQLTTKLLTLNWNAPNKTKAELTQKTIGEKIFFYKSGENSLLKFFLKNNKDLFLEQLLSIPWSSAFSGIFLTSDQEIIKPIFEVITEEQKELIALKFLNELNFSSSIEKIGRDRTISIPVWHVCFQEIISKIANPSAALKSNLLQNFNKMNFEVGEPRQYDVFFRSKIWNLIELFVCQPQNQAELTAFVLKMRSSPKFESSWRIATKNNKLLTLEKTYSIQVADVAAGSSSEAVDSEQQQADGAKKPKNKKKKKKAKQVKSAASTSRVTIESSSQDTPSQAVTFGTNLEILSGLRGEKIKEKIYLLREIKKMLDKIETAEEEEEQGYFTGYFKLIERLMEGMSTLLADPECLSCMKLCQQILTQYHDRIDQYHSALLTQQTQLGELLVKAQTRAVSPFSASSITNRWRSAPRTDRQSPGRSNVASPARATARFSTPENRRCASPYLLGVRKPTLADVRVERGQDLDEAEFKKFQASINSYCEALAEKARSSNQVSVACAVAEAEAEESTVDSSADALLDSPVVEQNPVASSNVVSTVENAESAPVNIAPSRPIIDVYVITTISSTLSGYVGTSSDLSFVNSEIVRPVACERRLSLNPSLLIVQIDSAGQPIYPAPPLDYTAKVYRLAGTAVINEKLNSVSYGMHILGFSLFPHHDRKGFYVVWDRCIYQVGMWVANPYLFSYHVVTNYFQPQQYYPAPTSAAVSAILHNAPVSSVAEASNDSLNALAKIQSLAGNPEAARDFFDSVQSYPELKARLIENACQLFINRLHAEKINVAPVITKTTEELFNDIVRERLRLEDLEVIVGNDNIWHYLRDAENPERYNIECMLIGALSHRFRHWSLFDPVFLDVRQLARKDYELDSELTTEFFNRLLEAWSRVEGVKKDNICLLPVLTLSMRNEIESAFDVAGRSIAAVLPISDKDKALHRISITALLIGRLISVMIDGRFEQDKIYIFPILKGRHYTFVAIENYRWRFVDSHGFDYQQSKLDQDIAFILAVLFSCFGVEPLAGHHNERFQEVGNTYLCGPSCLAVIGYMMHQPQFFTDGKLPEEYTDLSSPGARNIIQQINAAIRSMPDVNAKAIYDLTECQKVAAVSRPADVSRRVRFSLADPNSGASTSAAPAL